MKFLHLVTFAIVALVLGAIAAAAMHLPVTHVLSIAGALTGPAVFGMIFDSRNQFASATALGTGGTGLALVGNVIDLVKARDIGGGKQLYLVIEVTTAVTSAGAATVEFDLVSDSVAAIHTDGSATVHGKTAAIPKASLIAGFTTVIALPPEGSTPYLEFLGVLQNVGTAALTAGAINAFITNSPKRWKAYASGTTN